MDDASLRMAATSSEVKPTGFSPNPNHRAEKGIPLLAAYQKAIEKLATVSRTPINPYACRSNFQSTSLSFLGSLGGRRITSASGFSYASVVAAAQSVKQQM